MWQEDTARLGSAGAQGGTVTRAEHAPTLGLALWLEEDASRGFFAVSARIDGWLLHTRFFDEAARAHAALEEMRAPLEALARVLPKEGARPGHPDTYAAGYAIAAFTARYP